MRRLLPFALAAVALGATAGPAPAERATSVGVAEREFRISVYRPEVKPGLVRFNVRNYGEDAHNLVVRGPRGFRTRRTPEIRAGRTASLTVRLRREGTYRLLCTKGRHYRIGMVARLRVRR